MARRKVSKSSGREDEMSPHNIKFRIENFRSIRELELDIAPLTILYGANGSGKSSLLYSLFTLKKIVLDTNKDISYFHNLLFTSLGPYEEVVYNHRKDLKIGFQIHFSNIEEDGTDFKTSYGVTYDQTGNGELFIQLGLMESDDPLLQLNIPVSFPYALNKPVQKIFWLKDKSYEVVWNGINVIQLAPEGESISDESKNTATIIHKVLNKTVDKIRNIDIVPLKRGFTRFTYGVSPVTPLWFTDDEVVALLVQDPYLKGQITNYLLTYFNLIFNCEATIGTTNVQMWLSEPERNTINSLVNAGFGFNQLIYLMAKSLYRQSELICIEEPEIHFHPTAVRQVARMIAEIMRKEGKTFIISTHSESFLSALLTEVSLGKLDPKLLLCYFIKREGKETKVERQEVNDKGQISGGLGSFIEGEIEDLKKFLGVI